MRTPKKTLTHQTRRFASYAAIPKSYRELCELCLPRPIHDDAQDEEATAMMLALAGFTRLNPEQQDYLDVLTEFVDEYDQGKKIRWPKISGLDSLKYLLEENGMSAADQVRVASGNPVVVFNVCGNTYRLICAMHYDTGKVFLLRFLTHAEYGKDRWKTEL